jgi:hypothetical protein
MAVPTITRGWFELFTQSGLKAEPASQDLRSL